MAARRTEDDQARGQDKAHRSQAPKQVDRSARRGRAHHHQQSQRGRAVGWSDVDGIRADPLYRIRTSRSWDNSPQIRVMITIATFLLLWLLVSIVAGIAIGKAIKFGSGR
jgi:hypothetical protein